MGSATPKPPWRIGRTAKFHCASAKGAPATTPQARRSTGWTSEARSDPCSKGRLQRRWVIFAASKQLRRMRDADWGDPKLKSRSRAEESFFTVHRMNWRTKLEEPTGVPKRTMPESHCTWGTSGRLGRADRAVTQNIFPLMLRRRKRDNRTGFLSGTGGAVYLPTEQGSFLAEGWGTRLRAVCVGPTCGFSAALGSSRRGHPVSPQAQGEEPVSLVGLPCGFLFG